MSWKDYLNDNSNNNASSSGKIKWKDFLEENDNFKKYKADRATQAEESAKSLYSNQMDYTSPYYVQPKQTDITTPSVVSQPKNEDNGFWAKIRNLNLEDTPLFKAITSPIDVFYKIPLTQRILTTAGNTIGGEGAVQNPDGTPMGRLNAGKVGNIVSDLVGTGLGYSMPIAGLNNSLQGATSKIMQPIENAIPKGASKAAQYGNNALRQGLEFGALNAAQASAENKDYKDIGLSALEGLGQGAAFGTLTKGAGELIPKIKNSAFPEWKTTFESGNAEPLNSIENPLKQPQKTQSNIITPNEILKPIQSDKGVIDNKGFNLQMFDRSAEQPKKTSEFYSNSLKETQILPEEAKNLLNEADFTYGVKTNKAELLKAETRIKARGMDFEMNRLKQSKGYDNAEDTMAHLLITRNLNEEAQKTGDYSKVVDWLKETRAKTTNTAQALQAVSAWKKTTPEGALIKAQSVVDDVQKDINTHNPKLNNKIDNEVNAVKGAIEQAKKQAAKEIEQRLPEEMLASKVSSTLNEPRERKPNLVQDMVNELLRVAKESPLPERVAKEKRGPLEYLKTAIKNKSQYGDVWEKAKTIVKDKYKDDPQASQMLDDYFNKGIIPNYSNSTVGNSVKVSIKNLGTTLDNIARTSKGNKEQFLNDLTDYITKTTGSVGEDASLLASKIKDQYDSLINEKASSIVKQMFKEVPKAQLKTMEQKIAELVNLGAFDDVQLRDLVSQKYGVPTLTAEDAKFITETMNKAQSMEEGYNKNAEIAKVMQLIADKVPATASEKLQAYLRMSMLTNIKTLLVRNPLGNVGLNIAENIKDIPASLLDKAVSLKTGERTTIAPSLKGLAEQGKGLVQGVKEWNMDRKLNIDTSPSRGQYELPSKRIFHSNALNAIDQFTRRSLGLGDRPFYQAAYNERLRQLKVINKTNEITDAMKEDAVYYALDRTLQNKSTLSKGAGMIKKGLNLNKEFGLGSITMPFTTTPANVLDKALDYSPIGALKATAEWGKFLKTGDLNQKKLVDELGRSITGTAAIVLGWELAKNGLATGKSSTNARERELNKATGVNDYAFKIGDKYKTFDWAQPMSLPLAMGIDMYNAKKTKGDLKDALTSAGDTVFKQSFLQGISRMLGGYSPSEGILNTVGNSYSMAIPTTLRQTQQLSDPLQRETYSNNKTQQTLNTIKSKVPFLSKTLEPKIDVLGKPLKQFDGKNNLFNVLVNPGYSNTDKNTPGTNMVRQIVEDTNNKDILPKIPDNKITYVSDVLNKGTKNRKEVKETINLTPKELTSLKQYIGQETSKMYEEKAKDNTFIEKSPKDKAKELESLLRKIYDKGEENILKSRNITFY